LPLLFALALVLILVVALALHIVLLTIGFAATLVLLLLLIAILLVAIWLVGLIRLVLMSHSISSWKPGRIAGPYRQAIGMPGFKEKPAVQGRAFFDDD
jgi:hypothetical protein